MTTLPARFEALVGEIGDIGRRHHHDDLLRNAKQNLPHQKKTIRDVPAPAGEKSKSALVISAGPSLRKRSMLRRILDAKYTGTVVAIDGSLTACLREGLVPDYVLTLDPHPTRMVRWFGDHDLEEHTKNDDYFSRQDLDVSFRAKQKETNAANIELVNKYGPRLKVVCASSAPGNVVARLEEAKCEIYWWNPLVDDPRAPDSLTKQLYDINKLPAFNTGGNVGSAAFVFAATKLKIPRVGVLGMDLGYYAELPREQTQTYFELLKHFGGDTKAIADCFTDFKFPLTGETFYTDPVYFWYRKNLLQLLEQAPCKTFNCTEGGTLFGPDIACVALEDFIRG
ncbi:MAG: DUF115 domain-containing protein [Elusimicrobia bacterium]|nr:DUF115 domain-containing protein [Elusimicrobiota bacterium]